jgi:hypothetical protein
MQAVLTFRDTSRHVVLRKSGHQDRYNSSICTETCQQRSSPRPQRKSRPPILSSSQQQHDDVPAALQQLLQSQ